MTACGYCTISVGGRIVSKSKPCMLFIIVSCCCKRALMTLQSYFFMRSFSLASVEAAMHSVCHVCAMQREREHGSEQRRPRLPTNKQKICYDVVLVVCVCPVLLLSSCYQAGTYSDDRGRTVPDWDGNAVLCVTDGAVRVYNIFAKKKILTAAV
jgi:hypothetical protein